MIVSAIGRKVSPAWSGERPSTCCRYSELTYHIGKSAALNSSTMLLATCSGFVSALNGISGAAAKRVSMTTKSASSPTPTAIGTSAPGDLQPSRPAVTIP